MTTLLFLKSNWKLIAGIVLISALVYLVRSNINLISEKVRMSNNFTNITQENNRQLILKSEEWNNLHDKDKTKIDSLENENKILHKKVKSALVINTTFTDTLNANVIHSVQMVETTSNSLKPITGDILMTYYDIAVSVPEKCWGMKGVIRTTDPKAKLSITERTAQNSIQRLEVSNRFLGFLWITKKSKFKIYTDCGTSEITDIKFIK